MREQVYQGTIRERARSRVHQLCQDILAGSGGSDYSRQQVEDAVTAAYLERIASLCADPEQRVRCSELLEQVLQLYDPSSHTEKLSFQVLRFVGNCVADNDDNRTITLQHLDQLVQSLSVPYLRTISIQVLQNLTLDFPPAQRQLAQLGVHSTIASMLVKEGPNDKDNSAHIELITTVLDPVDTREAVIQDSKKARSFFKDLLTCALQSSSHLELFDAGHALSFVFPDPQGFLADENLFSLFARYYAHLARGYEKILARPELFTSDGEEEYGIKEGWKEVIENVENHLADAAYDYKPPPSESLGISIVFQAGLDLITNPNQHCTVGGCIVLGNVVRHDDRSQKMVEEHGIHKIALGFMRPGSSTSLLHAASGLLHNLAISAPNKEAIGAADPVGGILAAITLLEKGPDPTLINSGLRLLSPLLDDCSRNAKKLVDHPQETELKYIDTVLSCADILDGSFRHSVAHLLHETIRSLLEEEEEALDNLCRRSKVLQILIQQALSTDTEQEVSTIESWLALALLSTSKTGSKSIVSVLDSADGQQNSPGWDRFLKVAKNMLEREEPKSETKTASDVALEATKRNVLLLLSKLLESTDDISTPWQTEAESMLLSGMEGLEIEGVEGVEEVEEDEEIERFQLET